jgi:hypothetical protein
MGRNIVLLATDLKYLGPKVEILLHSCFVLLQDYGVENDIKLI